VARLTPEEMWRQMLTGNYPRLHGMRRMWGDAWVVNDAAAMHLLT
jgi:hypothetical protein